MKASINQISNKIELHYFFSDDSHTMDATIRNKCEHEILEIIKHVGDILNIELDIETEAYLEGGLKEWWSITLKKHPLLLAVFIGVLINVIYYSVNIFVLPIIIIANVLIYHKLVAK